MCTITAKQKDRQVPCWTFLSRVATTLHVDVGVAGGAQGFTQSKCSTTELYPQPSKRIDTFYFINGIGIHSLHLFFLYMSPREETNSRAGL